MLRPGSPYLGLPQESNEGVSHLVWLSHGWLLQGRFHCSCLSSHSPSYQITEWPDGFPAHYQPTLETRCSKSGPKNRYHLVAPESADIERTPNCRCRSDVHWFRGQNMVLILGPAVSPHGWENSFSCHRPAAPVGCQVSRGRC